MSLATILLTIALIIVLGAAIYLWIDRKDWIETARDAANACGMLKETYKELDSFAKALDNENAELTVKCYQYEALLKTRLDEIPVADLDECNQAKCDSGECCSKCTNDSCPGHVRNFYPEQPKVKPCCSCWNGAYNIPACEDCNEANGYENYREGE